MAKHGKRGKIEHHYTVTYDSGNYWSVITQRRGSDWPKLLPFCLANTAIMALLHVLLAYDIDLQISGQAHGFMSLVVGFLLVQRIVTSLARCDQGRDYLDTMNKSCRQLVSLATFYSNADTTEKGKEWRHQIAYRMLLLLRASMAVVDYPSTGIALWEIPELGPEVLDDVKSSLPPLQWLGEHDRSDFEWNLRIPVRLSYLLRQSIRTQETQLKTPMSMFNEADLYGLLNQFMDGYYG
jgi:Bestrophin, RFP-TM, chloride channel